MARMSRMDAAFLAMERPDQPGHLGTVMIFRPSDEGPLTYDVVMDAVAERLPLVPSARRVVAEVPLGLGRPSWAVSRAFDLEYHVRHTALPRGGGDAALGRLVGHTHAIQLDRARPLWELWVIEGLSGDRVALYSKVHVAAIDDRTGAELMTALLDIEAEGRPAVPPSEPEASAAGGARGALDGVSRLVAPMPDQLRWAAGFPGRLAERALRAAGEQWPGLRETAVEITQRTPVLGAVANLLPTGKAGDLLDEHPTGRAPRLSFNAPITAHRRFALERLPIESILAVKHAAGTTFNDVVVAVCAGALRRWLLAHDELPSSPLVALVPVLVTGASGRREDAHVAGLVASLPTNISGPAERLARTHDALAVAKERHTAVPASLLQDMSMFAPPAVAAIAGRFVDALPHRSFISPAVNVAITNVPGPRRPVHLAGRQLESSHPALSINDLAPVHIGMQSGSDVVGLGAVSCRDNLDDLGDLLAAAPLELAELVDAVAGRAARAGATRR